MSILTEYHLIIMIAALALLLFLSRGKAGRNRLLIFITITLSLSILYELVTDEPASRIPGRINWALNQPGEADKSSNPHYYISPEERYNLPQK